MERRGQSDDEGVYVGDAVEDGRLMMEMKCMLVTDGDDKERLMMRKDGVMVIGMDREADEAGRIQRRLCLSARMCKI